MIAWCSKCCNTTKRQTRLRGDNGAIVAEVVCDQCDAIHGRKLVKAAPAPTEQDKAPVPPEGQPVAKPRQAKSYTGRKRRRSPGKAKKEA